MGNHVKPLEAALTKAEAQNAATLAEHMANIIAQVGGAVAEEDGTVKMSMKCTCAYCNHISYSVEEATMHDAACEKHPAVIRAIKAEADNAMLVEALEKTTSILDIINEKMPGGTYYKKYEPLANDALMKARAALARVKEESLCPKN